MIGMISKKQLYGPYGRCHPFRIGSQEATVLSGHLQCCPTPGKDAVNIIWCECFSPSPIAHYSLFFQVGFKIPWRVCSTGHTGEHRNWHKVTNSKKPSRYPRQRKASRHVDTSRYVESPKCSWSYAWLEWKLICHVCKYTELYTVDMAVYRIYTNYT